jgi:hypothetical protein
MYMKKIWKKCFRQKNRTYTITDITTKKSEITSGKIEIFSKHQRFLIATDSSKYLLIFVLYVCVILCEFGTAISKRYYIIIIIIINGNTM